MGARFFALLSVATLAVIGLLASTGSAATFCVQDPACVTGGGTAQPTIASAIAAAASSSGRDRIQIGPGTFPEGGLVADSGNPVDIVGAGIGTTTIAPAAADGVTTLTLDESTSTVADLTIALAPGGQETGLRLRGGSASDVAVTAADGTSGTGVAFDGAGRFADGSVALPSTDTTGVVNDLSNSAGTVERSTVVAETGIQDVARVSRVRVAATHGVMLLSQSFEFLTTATIDDTLVQLAPGGAATGIYAGAGGPFGGATTLLARHVTVIGNGDPRATGISAAAATGDGFPATASVDVSSTILRDLGVDVAQAASAVDDPAEADIAIDYSDFDPAKTVTQNSSTPGASTGSGGISVGAHNLNVDPLFVNPAGGDYSLQAISPVIDRGSPTLTAGESTVDLGGNPRVIDGDGDGVAISDMGAYEHGPRPGCPLFIPGICCGHPGCCEACPPFPVTLTGLAVDPARFAVTPLANVHAARHPRTPRGTTIRFMLSRAASVRFTVQRSVAGRRSGRTCVKPTRRSRRAARCTRLVTVFAFTRDGDSGPNAIPFSGRHGRTPLRPGHYRLTAIPNDPFSSAPPSDVRFTILPTPRG